MVAPPAAGRRRETPRRHRTAPARVLMYLVSAVLLAFLMAPSLVVVLVSFSSSPYLQFPPPGFSLQWYREYLGDRAWMSATRVSLQVAALTTVLATTMGTMAAFGLVRGRFRGRQAVSSLLLAPLAVPQIVVAVGIYGLYADLRLIGNWLAISVAHTVLALPLVILTVGASLRNFDTRLEQAALSLGANRWQAIRYVTLPIIRPATVAAAFFAFIVSFDELIIAMFIGGVRMTLPKKMFDNILVEIDPTIAAISTLLIVLSCLVLAGAYLLGRPAGALPGQARRRQENG